MLISVQIYINIHCYRKCKLMKRPVQSEMHEVYIKIQINEVFRHLLLINNLELHLNLKLNVQIHKNQFIP